MNLPYGFLFRFTPLCAQSGCFFKRVAYASLRLFVAAYAAPWSNPPKSFGASAKEDGSANFPPPPIISDVPAKSIPV